jgi:hypothetical protein
MYAYLLGNKLFSKMKLFDIFVNLTCEKYE